MKKAMMKVNFVEGKIEMTPAFADAAGKIGSAEYKQLVGIQKDFPGFGIKVVAPKKKANGKIKGLTMEYMENYIKSHDDENSSILSIFAALRGMMVKDGKLVDDPSKAIKGAATYGEIKLWFLETYYEAFENYDKEAKEIMKKTKEARAKRLAA